MPKALDESRPHFWIFYFSMAVEHFEGRGTAQRRFECVASSPCAVHLRTYRCAEKNDNIVCAPTTLISRNRQTRAQSFSAQLNVQLITRSNSSCANARHNEFQSALRSLCVTRRMRRTSHFAIPRRAATIRICALAGNAIHVM